MNPPPARHTATETANLRQTPHAPASRVKGAPSFCPPQPDSLSALRLPFSFVCDLILKIMYFNGNILGRDVAERACLPWSVTSEAINFLTSEGYCGTTGIRGTYAGGDFAESLQYLVTGAGRDRAREILELNQYAGPAPVHLDDYLDSAEALLEDTHTVVAQDLKQALRHLVVPEHVIEVVGTALTGRQALFLYGPPGNGKSSIADACASVLGDPIFIPHALYVHGEVIRLFDPVHHRLVSGPPLEHDRRWVLVYRPVVHAGGELKGNELELSFDRSLGFYEAPLQLKANGGIFHVDDFGRQMIPPTQILNRLIVPLESKVDYLNVARAGTTVSVPYAAVLLLSTNLEPGDLVDEAFLRRVRYKALVPDPTLDEFRAIFQTVCRNHAVGYSDQALRYLLATHYEPVGRPLRGCHPRDVVEQLIATARYLGMPPELNQDLLDRVAKAYFSDIRPKGSQRPGESPRPIS